MLSMKKIREDLSEIRYYYSKQNLFDSACRSVAQSSVLQKVHKYNQAVKDAPARLYDLYISLYTQNNTQAALAYDWDCTDANIRVLNKKLCEYLQSVL